MLKYWLQYIWTYIFLDQRSIVYLIKIYIVKGNRNEQHLSVREESQVSSAYTDLDNKKKEANMYDIVNMPNLSTSLEQEDLTKHETTAYIEMRDARDTTNVSLEYVNITIWSLLIYWIFMHLSKRLYLFDNN